MDLLGWMGAGMLSLCGFPELWHSYKTKQCSLTWTFLFLWGAGELCILIPVIFEIKSPWLITNYVLNLICIAGLVYYKAKTV